jgi:hypothetical protein
MQMHVHANDALKVIRHGTRIFPTLAAALVALPQMQQMAS